MIRILPLLLLLAACGVDGAPVRPSDVEPRETPPKIIVSGSVGMGVSRTF